MSQNYTMYIITVWIINWTAIFYFKTNVFYDFSKHYIWWQTLIVWTQICRPIGGLYELCCYLLYVITSIMSHALRLSRHIILSLVMWHVIVLIDVIWFIRYKLFVWNIELRHQNLLTRIKYYLDETRNPNSGLSWSFNTDDNNLKITYIIN